MALYEYETFSFAWDKALYGPDTRVFFKDEFVEKYNNTHEKNITKECVFKGTYHKNGVGTMYIFFTRYKYPPQIEYEMGFHITEYELLTFMEGLGDKRNHVKQSLPKINKGEPDLSNKGMAWHFMYNDICYAAHSKIYITDDFMNKYNKEHENKIAKKVSFSFQILDKDTNQTMFLVYNTEDVLPPDCNKKDYKKEIMLTKEEFFEALEFIVEPYEAIPKFTFGGCEALLIVVCVLLIAGLSAVFKGVGTLGVLIVVVAWKVYYGIRRVKSES